MRVCPRGAIDIHNILTEEAKSYEKQEVCNERKTNFCREKA